MGFTDSIFLETRGFGVYIHHTNECGRMLPAFLQSHKDKSSLESHQVAIGGALPMSEPIERLSVTIPDAVRMTGIGRTTLYGVIKDGHLKTFKVKSRTMIRVADLRDLIDKLAAPSP
jgi:Helix-turn-helix domain